MRNIQVHHGDSREVLKAIPDCSIDSCVCDPPYALVSIGKRFGADGAAAAKGGKTGAYARASAGFMGQKWDTGETAFDPAFWVEVLRVLKPGAYLLAFGSTRSFHRLACAIEDGGFEIRDMVAWLYGTGFPKSHDVSNAIDKAAGAARDVVGSKLDLPGYHLRPHDGGEAFGAGLSSSTAETRLKSSQITAPATPEAQQWEGWGTALKPALEPICMARKPLSEKTIAANVLRWGTGAINIDASRVGNGESRQSRSGGMAGKASPVLGKFNGPFSTPIMTTHGRWPANVTHDGSDEVLAAFPETDEDSAARFFYSAVFGQDELLFWRAKAIVSAWNPDLANTADSLSSLSKEAVAFALSDVATSLCDVSQIHFREHFTSATPSELSRLCTTAIVVILSLDERLSLEQRHGKLTQTGCLVSVAETSEPIVTMTITISHWRSDGSAEPVIFSTTPKSRGHGDRALPPQKRFWYSAKAAAEDRLGSKHPTVKPVDLMAYYIRMVTHPGGTVLDPFAGSGSTGVAALWNGFDAILIEREERFVSDINRRLTWAKGEGRLTSQEIATNKESTLFEEGSLFGEDYFYS